MTLMPFEGGIDVAGTVTAPWTGICRRCAEPVSGELRIPVHERFADAPLAGASDEELYPIVDDTIDLGPLARDAVRARTAHGAPVPGGLRRACAPSAAAIATRATAAALPPATPGGLISTCSGSRSTPVRYRPRALPAPESIVGVPSWPSPRRRSPRPRAAATGPRAWRLGRPARSVCPHCQASKTPHVVCPSCGWYKGRQAVEVD